MSKNKKGKRKRDVRNKKNNFTQCQDNIDKENVKANKEKPNKNLHEKRFSFLRIIEGIMIALIAGVILFAINRNFLSPMRIDISTSQDGLVGHINIEQQDEECNVYFIDSNRNLAINLANNSDIYMQITDIHVNVIKCTDIAEEDITVEDYIMSGGVKKTIFLKTKIEHHTGKMETEINRELSPEYNIITDSDIYIPNNDGEKFVLSMDFEKQGYYNIEVEFNYRYDGKKRTIKTDPLNCIFLERYDR